MSRVCPPMVGAQVTLDDSRRVETGADGSYRFSRVPLGKHKLAVIDKTGKPTFFPTQSEVEVAENATVNFGIGFSLSGLIGRRRVRAIITWRTGSISPHLTKIQPWPPGSTRNLAADQHHVQSSTRSPSRKLQFSATALIGASDVTTARLSSGESACTTGLR